MCSLLGTQDEAFVVVVEKKQMLKFRPVQHNQPAHWYAGFDLGFVERQSQLLQHITCSHIPPTQRITQQSTRLTCATVLQHLLGVCRVAGRQVSGKRGGKQPQTTRGREGPYQLAVPLTSFGAQRVVTEQLTPQGSSVDT